MSEAFTPRQATETMKQAFTPEQVHALAQIIEEAQRCGGEQFARKLEGEMEQMQSEFNLVKWMQTITLAGVIALTLNKFFF